MVASELSMIAEECNAAQMALPPALCGAKELLFNRELSLLEFFRRVLEEAQDEAQPLLERLKFWSIFSSNVDEFFMIRVSGLKEQLSGEVTELSPDGRTPAAQLSECRERLLPMIAAQMRCLQAEVLPQLKSRGIHIAPYDSLADSEPRALDQYFVAQALPGLPPPALDPSHPSRSIPNGSLNLGLIFRALRSTASQN